MTAGVNGIYARYCKRGLDIICALLAMTAFCWLYGLIALLVAVKLGRPVIFRQPRPGKNGKIFTLYKFRTMTQAADEKGRLLPDGERLTRFGKRLRASSLDELPQAWNILRGDMSVVGPRPLLVQYLPLYNALQRRRHELRPGLTGYAQTHGRNRLVWEDRFHLDVWYVDHVSFCVDAGIIFDTIKAVLRPNGINCEICDTMQELAATPEKVRELV